MPKLTIENLTGGPFVIQDPSGLSNFNMDIAAGDTESADLSDAALAAIEDDLDAAQTAGKITWFAADDPTSVADSVPQNLRTALVTPVTVVKGEEIIVCALTAPGAVAAALPADAMVGDSVTVVDGTGDAAANNITVAQAGGTINGAATSVIATNYGSRTFTKTGALTWSAITTAAAAPSGAAGGDLAGSYPTPTIALLAVDNSKMAAGAALANLGAASITKAKIDIFASAEQTGTGAEQDIAHGLAGVPTLVIVAATAGDDGAGSPGIQMPVLVEGAHDGTNVKVTCTAGAKYKVVALA